MSGQAKETDASCLTRLDERLECSPSAEDHLEVTGSSQIVKLPQVEMVSAQSLEAFIKKPQRAIACSVMSLRGKKDLAAPLS